MISSAALHTQLAAVMESLVHAAVAELKKLGEDSLEARASSPRSGAGGEAPVPGKAQPDGRQKMVRGPDRLENY